MRYVALIALVLVLAGCSENLGGEASRSPEVLNTPDSVEVQAGNAVKCEGEHSISSDNSILLCDNTVYHCTETFKQADEGVTIWLC